jgi:hypothetical protein
MIAKALKVLCLLLGLVVFSASAFESYFKVKMHKELVQSVFQQNLRLLFSRTDKMQPKDQFLDDIKAKMTDIQLNIRPSNNGDWKDHPLEMLVDEGQMIFEIHDLEFAGTGNVLDPKT